MKMVTVQSVATINPPAVRSGLTPTDIVPFIAMADISDEGYIANIQQKLYEEVRTGYTGFQQGDILIVKITPCFENAKRALVDIPGKFTTAFGSTEFHVVRPSGSVYPRFLFHALSTPIFRFLGERAMTGAAGQRRIPARFIADYNIPLPALEEQRRIAAMLDRADAIRRKRQEALKLADDFLKSVFLDIFGDPVTNPKRWETRPLGDMVKVCSSKRVYQQEQSASLVYRWVMEAGAELPECNISNEINEMEFDEMWHFIGSKKANFGLSRRLTVAHGELWPGCSVIVILQRSNVSTKRSII